MSDKNNTWDASKSVLKGKFVGLNAYVRKEEKQEIKSSVFIWKYYHKKISEWSLKKISEKKVKSKIS